MQRYIIPLGVLVVGSIVITFLANILSSTSFQNLYTLLVSLMLFAFGMTLNAKKGKLKNFSIRHIIIVILVILLYLFDTNIVDVKLYNWFLSFTVSDLVISKLLYVYFGWLFNER